MFNTGFPPEWSTLKKLVWLVGSGIAGAAAGIWKTVTGTLIHITDALASPMQKCEVNLEPIQDLHGQDAPYPAGGGKNKWSDGNQTIDAYKLVPITVPAGNWTFSALVESTTELSHAILFKKNADGTGATVGSTAIGNGTGRRSNSFGLLAEAKSVALYAAIAWNESQGQTTTYTDIQLESGTTQTPYSPYSNICPITGWTGCEVWNDPKYGGLINWNQLITNTAGGTTTGGITYTFNGDGSITFSGEATSNFFLSVSNPYPQFIEGHKYLILGCPSGGSNQTYSLRYNSNGYGETGSGIIVVAVSESAGYGQIRVGTNFPTVAITNGTDVGTQMVFKPQVFDLTEMFGAGNEPSTVAEFKALFPKDYYEYNAGTETTVSAVNGDPYQHLSVTFPETVYGGKYDFVGGEGHEDYYCYEPLNPVASAVSQTSDVATFDINFTNNNLPKSSEDVMVSNRFSKSIPSNTNGRMVYAYPHLYLVISKSELSSVRQEGLADWFANNPTQFLYKLEEPTEIQLTPQPISTLNGVNNVWSNTNGDTTIIYKAQA